MLSLLSLRCLCGNSCTSYVPELPQNHSGDVVLKLNFKRGDRRKDFHTVGKNSFFEGGGASGVLL